MESGRRKTRIKVQDDDRLSNLPDDLIHKILSLVGTKLAVQASALSSRWRYLWTLLPCLNLSKVSSAKLSFRGKASQAFVKKILNYAFSHNIKQLTVSCLSSTEFSLSLFRSQSLEHLTIAGLSYESSIIPSSTWELTSLTTVHLEYIEFNDEVTAKDNAGIFSKCVNLKKLVLRYCTMTRPNGVDICHPGLSNLTLENGHFFKNVINVVAPQLKDLIVRNWQGLHLISAPELVSLRFEGLQSQWLKFSSYGLCSLENVDLCITKEWSYKLNKPDAHKIFELLQQLHSVKYLTLNLEIFQLLSPLMEQIAYQPSPFVNLKSLKVYPDDLCVKVLQTIPGEVKKYLLDGSPSATLTEVSYEEMRALRNAESVLTHMTRIGVILEREKANSRTNLAHLDRVMAPVECHEQDKMQIGKWEMRGQIDSCWKDLSAQIKHGKKKTRIISMMIDSKLLLIELPATKRAHIEKSFTRLLTEADIVINAIMNSMKIQFDEKQSNLSLYFHELATKVLQTTTPQDKKYLLDGSPSATFTEVSYEEMRVLENAKSALNCMAELREMLEHEKINIETNIAHRECHEQDKMQIGKREMRRQIDSCWKDLSAQIKHGQAKTCGVISKLCHIEELLTELPTSKRAQIEASFSRLCREADIVMNAIMNSLKVQSDEKQSRLSIYFHELAIASEPSF